MKKDTIYNQICVKPTRSLRRSQHISQKVQYAAIISGVDINQKFTKNTSLNHPDSLAANDNLRTDYSACIVQDNSKVVNLTVQLYNKKINKNQPPTSYITDIAADAGKMAKISAVSPELAADILAGRIFIGNADSAFNAASQPTEPQDGEPNLSAWEIARRAQLPLRAVPYAEGKRSGEKVLDYYERCWGSYRDAGILYRDDIARLGGGNLVHTVSVYCSRRNVDPEKVLPAPATQRDEDELSVLDASSRDAAYLRTKIAKRNLQRKRNAPL